MLTLVLDTSAGTSVALVAAEPSEEGTLTTTVLAEASDPDPRHHAELLAPMVEQVLQEAGLSADATGVTGGMASVECIVVGTGPAPFTGLRVGLVTARTLARARGVEVLGVPSLDAWGRTLLDASDAPDVAVVTDARRKEVYAARYRPHGTDDVRAVVPPLVVQPGAALAALGIGAAGGASEGDMAPPAERVDLGGPGTHLYPEELPGTSGLPARIDPAAMVRVALARRRARDLGASDVPTLDTEPLYLRRPDVHERGPAR